MYSLLASVWNSSLVLSFALFICLTFGCGVKTDPTPPPGTAIPNYFNPYITAKKIPVPKQKKEIAEDKEKEDKDKKKEQP